MATRSKSRYSEENYQQLLANLARNKKADAPGPEAPGPAPRKAAVKKQPKAALSAPEADCPSPGSLAAALGIPSGSIVSEKKKRQGVKETPIMTAVRECSITVETGPSHIVIVFEGARLFTLNELLAILQFRKYVVFGYKKLWQELVLRALAQMGKSKPHFDGPCNVILFRQGAKMIDRDSFTVMFKYIIDALKDEPKKNHRGIFPDDNPDIVFSDEKRQAIGPPIIALRVELIQPSPAPQLHTAEELFTDASLWRGRPIKALPPIEASAASEPLLDAKKTRARKGGKAEPALPKAPVEAGEAVAKPRSKKKSSEPGP